MAIALSVGLNGASWLSAAELQWGRPAPVEPASVSSVGESSSEFETPSDLSRESAVMAAAWEEDDALAAELDSPLEEAVVEESETRSIVTKRELSNPLNTVDPFEGEDRFAQLPNDPFDEPTGDTIPDLEENQNLDEIETALDREIERREAQMEEPAEIEEAEQETLEDEPLEDAVDKSQINQGQGPESDFNFELRTPPRQQPETLRPYQQEQGARMADELEQSQKSCEEELAALRADHINTVDLSIRVEGTAGEDYPYECAIGDDQLKPRVWPEITYTWKASALCHKPLYFEDVQLERYGHSWPRCAQPLVSGAHFFGSVAILPYKMGLETPNECIYALGHYRPGSCAPYYIEALPFTWRAAAFQTGVITGIHFALP